jgi:hypothetical protein
MGSGQFDTPWERMHPAKRTNLASVLCNADCVGCAPFGRRCAQVRVAASSWELLTPSPCALTFANPSLPPFELLGSGYFTTPCDRMQVAKASALAEIVDSRAFEVLAEPVDGAPPWVVVELSCATPSLAGPPHAANAREKTASAKPAVAMLAARDHPRPDRPLDPRSLEVHVITTLVIPRRRCRRHSMAYKAAGTCCRLGLLTGTVAIPD